MKDELLNYKQAAEKIGIPVHKLQRLKNTKHPDGKKILPQAVRVVQGGKRDQGIFFKCSEMLKVPKRIDEYEAALKIQKKGMKKDPIKGVCSSSNKSFDLAFSLMNKKYI